ncbi:YidC/Oxa1 family membrane protein insertase [Pullulanibacillus pueri]|uniref:Membrane protein insertase YidC n=1 Tax=Pullulanibacillus pueri TaxID=1437324 RepID=A0A8J2ZZ57_9BACL|nr:membrane protein insertase YidC [Pullulanibacillus pueri]MBM7683671.1 YidC/Oxa1 family membrane protein insertase [Pullulanibacillus pueri]GGH87159.1 membrane protein insertase YidC 1 [Pullulanibacillus pueri]
MKKVLVLSLLGIFILTGCGTQGSSGMFHNTFIVPFIGLIHWTASLFDGSYGMAIIFLTIVIRFILSPLMLRQYKHQADMKEKMEALKPEMEAIRKQLKETSDQQKQKELQQEMMGLYRKHGVNPLGGGCLPLIIQMPILMAFYYAIRTSKDIATHNFLWFSLGQPDHILMLIAGAVYFLQFRVQQSFLPKDQANTMKWMGLVSPIMIMFMSWQAPAAFPLYWTVGGLFLMGQSWYGQYLIKKQKEKLLTTKGIEK